ncbi:FHA domain-containing protein [Symmachiella dynata]|uniref:FHA domain-containing protein n=1 Tax=Symmachiella dynata TaxID=2527995 RepID=UPI001189B19C|nr:FHA domain-containing protein [Symmachiella dynata]QDT46989.1 FHA domain protein [Symmachiella dynata]
MATLIVQNGKHQGTKIPLPNREVTVGRDDKCYVRLTSGDVSRVHCSLLATNEGILIKDSGSQNGVIINGMKIEGDHMMRPGDLLKIGPVKFTMEIPQLAAPAGAADDDSIATWLAEGDTNASAADSETTEIQTVEANREHSTTAELPPAEPEAKSIAEEAQDIIRRHFEMKKK